MLCFCYFSLGFAKTTREDLRSPGTLGKDCMPLYLCAQTIRGSGWSPLPMGFGIRIVINGGNSQGGVHKLNLFIREKLEECVRN